MSRIRSVVAILLAAIWLAASVAWAQQDLSDLLGRWETLAKQAETAVESDETGEDLLEAMRGSIAGFREDFDEARGANSERIASLREQISALGAPPEDGTGAVEAPDVTAKREELTQSLNALLVPIQKAEAEFVRADALIRQIDQIIRDRQTRELFKTTPTPLNPANWSAAFTDLGVALANLRDQTELHVADGYEKLPMAIGLALVGLLLLLRGRLWSQRLTDNLRNFGVRGLGIWRLVASLLRVVLPFAGLVLLMLSVLASPFFSTAADNFLFMAVVLCGVVLAIRWVAERVFSKDDDEVLIPLPPEDRSKVRLHVGLIAGLLVISLIIEDLLDQNGAASASVPLLRFPIMIFAALSLFRIGLVLRRYQELVSAEAESDGPAASTLKRIVQGIGNGALVVAVLTPLLGASGYSNAAEGLFFPYFLTMALFGLLMVLQRFASDIYGAITGQGREARDSLLTVLIGLVLLILAIPLLALIWGARITDLTELWAAIGRGFTIGESRISPADFLAFAVIFAIGYFLTRLVQSSLRSNVLPKTRMEPGAQNAVVSGLGYVGIFLAALAAITGAGIDLSSLAIVAGALSVGIGFGLQNIVSNFVSGIILLIERPISEGDWIEVGGSMGYVRQISVRSTRIETFDRTDVIVPNADLVSGTVTNYTRGNTIGRVIVPVGVAYGTDTKKVEAILREIAEAQPMALSTPPPGVFFMNFGADALEFEIRCFLRDVNWMLAVKSDINHQIAERFAREGIEIPFAQRDVWLRNPEVLRGTPARPPQNDQGEQEA